MGTTEVREVSSYTLLYSFERLDVSVAPATTVGAPPEVFWTKLRMLFPLMSLEVPVRGESAFPAWPLLVERCDLLPFPFFLCCTPLWLLDDL